MRWRVFYTACALFPKQRSALGVLTYFQTNCSYVFSYFFIRVHIFSYLFMHFRVFQSCLYLFVFVFVQTFSYLSMHVPSVFKRFRTLSCVFVPFYNCSCRFTLLFTRFHTCSYFHACSYLFIFVNCFIRVHTFSYCCCLFQP